MTEKRQKKPETGKRLRLIAEDGRRLDVVTAERADVAAPGHLKVKSRSKRKVLKLETHKCRPCSEMRGYDFGALLRLRIGAQVLSGKLVGGHWWWSCAACQKPYFHDGPVEAYPSDTERSRGQSEDT